ncbi:protein SanA [Sphingobacteriaceae bacterium]|nr:protein SanA [Sphingobacteriaceae bacterium]
MRTIKLLLYFIFISLIISLLALYCCNRFIDKAAEGKFFTDVEKVPYHKVGLLLGTSKFLGNGVENPYFNYRINAAVELYKAKKISYILVSGDNSRKEYDEPNMMKTDLINAGVDSTRIFLDYAGFRTFDSMVRLKEVFGQNSVTIISQQFHNERALYIARREGIEAVAFNAKDVGKRMGFRTQLREKFARVKVFVDYLFGNEPKFLGPKVLIPA